MGIVVGEVIRHAGQPRVHIRPAKLFGRHDLARRCLYQRRAGQEDGALFLDDDGLVRHGRHIGSTRRARAHDDGDLRNALRAHVGLVEEDAAKMIAVREHLVLVGQVRPAGINEIDARQPVGLGNLLGAQVLLDRHRVIGAALHCGVVGDDHHLTAFHPAHTGNDAGAWRVAIVEPMRRGRANLKERRAGIQQPRHPFARQDLAAADVALARGSATTVERGLHCLVNHRQCIEHGLAVGVKGFTARGRRGFENGHQAVSLNISRPMSMRRISLVPAPIS